MNSIHSGSKVTGDLLSASITLNEFQEMVRSDVTDCILDTDEKAIDVTFYFVNPLRVLVIPCIFKKINVSVDPGTGIPVIAENPMLRTALSEFTYRKLKKGDYCKVRGTTYDILESNQDNTLMTTITLAKK